MNCFDYHRITNTSCISSEKDALSHLWPLTSCLTLEDEFQSLHVPTSPDLPHEGGGAQECQIVYVRML